MTYGEGLEAACRAMNFSFTEIVTREGYPAALRKFCEVKRMALMALAVDPHRAALMDAACELEELVGPGRAMDEIERQVRKDGGA